MGGADRSIRPIFARAA